VKSAEVSFELCQVHIRAYVRAGKREWAGLPRPILNIEEGA